MLVNTNNGRVTCRFLCLLFSNTKTREKTLQTFASEQLVQTFLFDSCHVFQRVDNLWKQAG